MPRPESLVQVWSQENTPGNTGIRILLYVELLMLLGSRKNRDWNCSRWGEMPRGEGREEDNVKLRKQNRARVLRTVPECQIKLYRRLTLGPSSYVNQRFPFYRGGNQRSERPSTWLRTTQLVSGSQNSCQTFRRGGPSRKACWTMQ